MNEAEACAWLHDRLGVSRETIKKLHHFVDLVLTENQRQNLIGETSEVDIWHRHIIDSAQLLSLCPNNEPSNWLDLGTGAGFPGMVIAIISERPITLVDERRKRAEFLVEVARTFGLSHVTVEAKRVQALASKTYPVISARAFAPLGRLFELAYRFSNGRTQWVLPKGRSAQTELESIRSTWQGMFHVKQSLTSADAAVIIATNVQRVGTA